MAEKDSSYKKAQEAYKSLADAGEFYKQVSHMAELPERASNLAEELGDKTAARYLLDPNTPQEEKARWVQGAVKLKELALEEIVSTDFRGVLRGARKRDLEASLNYFLPRKDIPSKYEKIAEAHRKVAMRRRNLGVYNSRNKLDESEVTEAVGNMQKEVFSYYKDQYKAEKGDNKYVREKKKIAKELFIGLFFASKDALAEKYRELTEEAEETIKGKLDSEEKLAGYIAAALPQDVKSKMGFVNILFGKK